MKGRSSLPVDDLVSYLVSIRVPISIVHRALTVRLLKIAHYNINIIPMFVQLHRLYPQFFDDIFSS